MLILWQYGTDDMKNEGRGKVYQVPNVTFGFRSHTGNTRGSMLTSPLATRIPPFLETCCQMPLVALVSHGYVMLHHTAPQ